MNNREYWAMRMDKLVNSLMNSQERDTISFLRAYKNASIEVQGYINSLYSKYSENGKLTLSEMYKYNRFEAMEKEINSIISSLGKEERKYMTNELKNIYSKSYIKTGELITKVNSGIKVDFNIINKNAVEKAITYPWSGDMFSNRIHNNLEKLVVNLKQTVTQGLVQGKSISEMSKELRHTMNMGATNSRRLIRTETMHVIASSHHDVYTKAGVEKVEFVTAKDDRVCDECDSLDGEIFELNDAPIIPLHPNSRSILIPIFD